MNSNGVFTVLAALVEGVKIIDDIQDEEPRCLAADVGIEPAIRAAIDAFALELTADLHVSRGRLARRHRRRRGRLRCNLSLALSSI